jgi:hypothetical protein
MPRERRGWTEDGRNIDGNWTEHGQKIDGCGKQMARAMEYGWKKRTEDGRNTDGRWTKNGQNLDGKLTETLRKTDGKLMDMKNAWHMLWNMDGTWMENVRNIYGKRMELNGTQTEDGRKMDGTWAETGREIDEHGKHIA